MAFADDARQARLPRHDGHRGQVAHGHEVGAVRLNAHTANGKPGKARAVGHHGVQMLHRHRLGLGHAVNVDELRQHISHPLRLEVSLGFCDAVKAFRGHQPTRLGWGGEWNGECVQGETPSVGNGVSGRGQRVSTLVHGLHRCFFICNICACCEYFEGGSTDTFFSNQDPRSGM